MINIISVEKITDSLPKADNIFYIENSEKLNSMAKKYNFAIENICNKSNDNYFCFRHEDAQLVTPQDIIKYKLDNLFKNYNIGVAGVIGTYALENSGVWWMPNREINGAGSIVQGYANGESRPMNDWPGMHTGLASVDGCCLFLSRKLIDAGIRFDENLPDYHFYDADICCQALQANFKVATIDIKVFHRSEGNLPPNFDELRRAFLQKWSAKIDAWPITRYTKFK